MTTNKDDVESNIKELEKTAERILDLKRQANPRRPLVIEFCGSPKSGKSACINSLDMFLRRNKFRTRILSERASVCPISDKFDPNFNIWTVCSAIAELTEILSNYSKDCDVVILDRGLFDAICWFEWLHKEECLDDVNHESLVSFLTMKKWRETFDLVYIFTATPEESLRREYANLLTRKTGSIMQPKVLNSYREAVEKCEQEYGRLFRNVQIFDTSNTDLNEVNYQVTKNVLSILYKSVAEKIGYFPASAFRLQANTLCRFDDVLIDKAITFDFDSRSNVEDNPERIQPIPILVVTDPEHSRVLVAKKSKRASGIRSPEFDKTLLYFGGHVREEDTAYHPPSDILQIMKTALCREIREEIDIHFSPDEENPYCIWSDTTERSQRHLAICFLFEKPLDFVRYKLDKYEFVTRSGSVKEIEEFCKHADDLEDWSRVIFREVFGKKFQAQAEQMRLL